MKPMVPPSAGIARVARQRRRHWRRRPPTPRSGSPPRPRRGARRSSCGPPATPRSGRTAAPARPAPRCRTWPGTAIGWRRRGRSPPAGRRPAARSAATGSAAPVRARAPRRSRPPAASAGPGSPTPARTAAGPPSRCTGWAPSCRRPPRRPGRLGESSSPGASTDTWWPSPISVSARSRTCACTPPGMSHRVRADDADAHGSARPGGGRVDRFRPRPESGPAAARANRA